MTSRLRDRNPGVERPHVGHLEPARSAARGTAVSREEERVRLAAAAGTGDPALLDALLAAGVRAESLPAAEWIPLVCVAWADGTLDAEEKRAVFAAAAGDGVASTHPARALLRRWLESRPGPELLDAWEAYLRASAVREVDLQRTAREGWVADRAFAVARASGGWLGLSPVSRSEADAIVRIRRRLQKAARVA